MTRAISSILAVAAVAATFAAGAARADSPVDRQTAVIELTGTVEDACSEPILLTGGRVIETIQVFDDPNGRSHFLYYFRTDGLVGLGLDSGAIYRDFSHGTQTGIGSIEEGFGTGGFTVHVRISSTDGAVEDLVLRWSFHIVKRGGENRILMDRITIDCG